MTDAEMMRQHEEGISRAIKEDTEARTTGAFEARLKISVEYELNRCKVEYKDIAAIIEESLIEERPEFLIEREELLRKLTMLMAVTASKEVKMDAIRIILNEIQKNWDKIAELLWRKEERLSKLIEEETQRRESECALRAQYLINSL
jgi:hypothetical protein